MKPIIKFVFFCFNGRGLCWLRLLCGCECELVLWQENWKNFRKLEYERMSTFDKDKKLIGWRNLGSLVRSWHFDEPSGLYIQSVTYRIAIFNLKAVMFSIWSQPLAWIVMSYLPLADFQFEVSYVYLLSSFSNFYMGTRSCVPVYSLPQQVQQTIKRLFHFSFLVHT